MPYLSVPIHTAYRTRRAIPSPNMHPSPDKPGSLIASELPMGFADNGSQVCRIEVPQLLTTCSLAVGGGVSKTAMQ